MAQNYVNVGVTPEEQAVLLKGAQTVCGGVKVATGVAAYPEGGPVIQSPDPREATVAAKPETVVTDYMKGRIV